MRIGSSLWSLEPLKNMKNLFEDFHVFSSWSQWVWGDWVPLLNPWNPNGLMSLTGGLSSWSPLNGKGTPSHEGASHIFHVFLKVPRDQRDDPIRIGLFHYWCIWCALSNGIWSARAHLARGHSMEDGFSPLWEGNTSS
jgi:hypothetical protein